MSFQRLIAFAIAGLSACVISTSAQAQLGPGPCECPNIVKGGVAHFMMNDSSSELSGPSTPPGVTVEVDDATAATFTYTRLIGEHFGVELIGGIPFDVDVTAAGTLDGLGKVSTITVATASIVGNYYFTPRGSRVRPYVGLSYNYTTFYDGEATPALNGALSGETEVEASDSTGPGVYAGVNYALDDHWLVSGLIGYTKAETDVTLTTDTVVDLGAGPMSVGDIERDMEVELNPVTLFAMVGYRF